MTALRGVLRTKTEDVLKAQQTARGNDSTENLLRLQYALTEQAAIQESLHGVTAEAGRALRAYRMPVEEALGSGDLPKMEKLLRYMGGPEQAKQMAGALAKIDVDDPRAVNAFIRATMKPGVQDYITELFYNSILSGPKTHVVNTVSNAVQALLDPVERSAAAGVDVVLANLPGALGRGGQRERFQSEAGRSLYGATAALPEAARAFAYTLKNGFSPAAASKFEFRPRAFEGKLGRVINAPSTLLEASDQFFYIVNQRAALHAQAYRMAKGKPEGIADLLENPTKELLEQADKMAEYRLFRNESDAAAAIIKFRDMTVPIGEDTLTGKPLLALQPMRFFVPFVRTPWNLLKYGLERSALGFLNPELYINLARKDPAAADQIARAGLGTGLAAGVYMLVKDNINGAAPENSAERDRFYREGKQPYSIKVGDQWVPFSRLEPLNQTLNQLATLVNATKVDDKTFDQKSLQFVADITKNLASQTFMSGINDLIQMVTEPERYGARPVERLASSLLVPASSAARTAAQAFDPVIRQPEGIPETIAANIPGLSQTVPARLDAFGNPAQRLAGQGTGLGALNPYQSAKEVDTPLYREMSRLGYNLGFTGTSISNVRLSREEEATYQRIAGQLVEQEFNKAITDNSYSRAGKTYNYQKLNDVEKTKLLDLIVADQRAKARTFVTNRMKERLKTEAGVPAGAAAGGD